VPFHNSIIGNFMAYQGRFETNLLQLFVHPESSEWFSIISGIIFELNIDADLSGKALSELIFITDLF